MIGLREVHREIEQLVEGGENVLVHAIFHARASREKVLDYIASVDGQITHPLSNKVFKTSERDNSLKWWKSFLEH